MVWIKETKNQREVSKNKNPPAPLRKATATRRRCEGTAAVRAQMETKRGRLAQGAQPRAPPLPSPRCWKSLARSRTRAPRPREAGRQEETGAQPAGGQGPRLPGLFPTRTAPQRPRAMRPPTAAPCPGRTLWSPWRSFLPLALALVLGVGHAQRYPVGRYEPADRDSSRLWRPGGSHPAAATAQVYSLFREQDAPVPGSPPAKVAQPGWGSARRSTETEARRPPRAQQPRRVRPPAQTWRSSPLGQQQFAPRARAAPALLSFGTQQRPGAASPTPPRRRLTG